MYSLDINFLSDRTERPVDAGFSPQAVLAQDSSRPLYLGLAVGIFFPALVLVSWLLLQNRNANLREQQAQLDSQLASLQIVEQELTGIRTEIGQINQDVEALATVFDQIIPWSAMLQNIQDNVPSSVQVLEITQLEEDDSVQPQQQAASAPTAEGQPPQQVTPPPSPIAISGQARSFNDVNDFLLTLQRSPFLQGDETRLISAELVDDPRRIEFAEGTASDLEVQLPQVVEYTIQSRVTGLTASELLPELERTLAVGLTARIQALRDRGVLQP